MPLQALLIFEYNKFSKIGKICKIVNFGQKLKGFKNMRKTSLEAQQKCSTQKSTKKTPNIRKITSVPKSEKSAIMHGL